MRIIVSVSEKYTNHCLHITVYTVSSEHSVLRVWMIWKRDAYACCINIWMPTTISWQLFAHFHCSFHGSQTRTYERFRGSKWCIRNSRTGFRVVLVGWILVLTSIVHPATAHCGQRCNLNRYPRILIYGRMHANSDTDTVPRVRILQDDEIRFTTLNVVFKRSY